MRVQQRYSPPPRPFQVGAVEAFSWLLILAYTAFSIFLNAYKDTLLPPPMSAQDHQSGLPPAQPAFTSVDGGYGGNADQYRDSAPSLAAPGGSGPSVL